ncbi:DUF2298 domain-containing protein [Halarchaeum nitratireducens]|uniref:Chlor_Arch_YYY domain-containing protein n=1 Tax=Halarchaeum nitratireducens TaxID=489913 RepID=A0A830G9G3_9EURY|nr:DUF2298 domain-containing protein [Halarchaeum nitratireducens]GGN12456.1 hypothetical protein GCM10009021_10570 [Halarchaeum nitratireducens]
MSALHALGWLAALLVVAAAGLPLAARVLPDDHAAGLAPAIGLAAVTLPAYWLGHLEWGRATAAVAALVTLGLGLLVARRDGLPPIPLGPVLAFALAFCGLLAYRSVFPGVYPAGGEKFLDYGLLKSLSRASALPPQDVWFAGRPVRYYYGGLLAVASVTELSGVPVRYAYNLGLATFYATLASAAYAVAAAVADANGNSPVAGGAFGACLVAVAGHLVTPVRVVVGLLPEDVALPAFDVAFAGVHMEAADAYAHYHSLGEWTPWLGRYVAPGTLHVTPAWEYTNADLHAHMLATPFLLVAAALAFALSRTDETRRALALLCGLGCVAGLLALVSTWSYPSAVGLTGLALAFADRHPGRLLGRHGARLRSDDALRDEVSRLVVAVAGALAVALGGAALASPFLLFHTPVNGGVGVLPPRTPVVPFLLASGVPLAAFGLRVARDATVARRTLALAAGLLVAGIALATLASLGTAALLLACIAAGWYLRRRRDAGFDLLLLVAGAGLLLAVEFAYAKVWPHDPNAPRWNTVYKVSMQAWVLWGVGTGAALAGVLPDVRPRLRALARPREIDVSPGRVARVAAVALVLGAGLAFPALAVSDRVGHVAAHGADPTLDATEYVEERHPGEAAAIDWLDAREGASHLVEAPGTPMYQFRSEASSLTGLPSVVGWHHEQGYRGPDAWETRTRDVDAIYAADWESAALLLDEYDVTYVYVGPNERERYDVRSFDRPGVEVTFENDAVTIYEVDPDAACEAVRTDCPRG